MNNINKVFLKLSFYFLSFSGVAFAVSTAHPLFTFNLVMPFYIERLLVEGALYVTTIISEIFYTHTLHFFIAFFLIKLAKMAVDKAEAFSFQEVFEMIYVSPTNNLFVKILLYYFAINSFLAPSKADLYSMGGTMEDDPSLGVKTIFFQEYTPMLTKAQLHVMLKLQSVIPVPSATDDKLVAPTIALAPAAIFARYVYGAPQDGSNIHTKTPLSDSVIMAPVIGNQMQLAIVNPSSSIVFAISAITGATPTAKIKLLPIYYTKYNRTLQKKMLDLDKANAYLKRKFILDYKNYLNTSVFQPLFEQFVAEDQTVASDKGASNKDSRPFSAKGGPGILNAILIFANYSGLMDFKRVAQKIKDDGDDAEGTFGESKLSSFFFPDAPNPFASDEIPIIEIFSRKALGSNDEGGIYSSFVGSLRYETAFSTFVDATRQRNEFIKSPFGLLSGTTKYNEQTADQMFDEMAEELLLPEKSFTMFTDIAKPYFLDFPGKPGTLAESTLFSAYFFHDAKPGVLRPGFRPAGAGSETLFSAIRPLVFHDEIDLVKEKNDSYKKAWQRHVAILITDYWLSEYYKRNNSSIRSDISNISSRMSSEDEASEEFYITDWGVSFSKDKRSFDVLTTTTPGGGGVAYLAPLQVFNQQSDLVHIDSSRFDWVKKFASSGVEGLGKISTAMISGSKSIQRTSPDGEPISSECYIKPRFTTKQFDAIKDVSNYGLAEMQAYSNQLTKSVSSIFLNLDAEGTVNLSATEIPNFSYSAAITSNKKGLLPDVLNTADVLSSCTKHKGAKTAGKVVITSKKVFSGMTINYLANVPQAQYRVSDQVRRVLDAKARAASTQYSNKFATIADPANQDLIGLLKVDYLNSFSFLLSRSPELQDVLFTPIRIYPTYGTFISTLFSGVSQLATDRQSLSLLFNKKIYDHTTAGRITFINASSSTNATTDVYALMGAGSFTKTLFGDIFHTIPVVPHTHTLYLFDWTQDLMGISETIVNIAFKGNFLNNGSSDFLQDWFNEKKAKDMDDVKNKEDSKFVPRHPWESDLSSDKCNGTVDFSICAIGNSLAWVMMVASAVPVFGNDSKNPITSGNTDDASNGFVLLVIFNFLALASVAMMVNFYLGSLFLFTGKLFSGIISWSTVFVFRFFNELTNPEKSFKEVIPSTLLELKSPFISLSGILFFSVVFLVMHIAFAIVFEVLILTFGQYGESPVTSYLVVGSIFFLFWKIFGSAKDMVAELFKAKEAGAAGLLKSGASKVMTTVSSNTIASKEKHGL